MELLVKQFSQPLAFLRELVQNSLDAQTNRIDIEVVHEPAENLQRISVHDTGEGMNREIIDLRLTRLFASDKENDLTKVGKFGIGFVSVFAIGPEAVVVDTGRDGESWRLVFHPDRTFDRIRLEEVVEGCHVSVYVKPGKESLTELIGRCRETIVYWCKHCRTDIFLNGERINQPFQFSGGFQVSYESSGTRLVVQPVTHSKPFFGFYNQGLTLLEGQGSPLANIAFKLDSRYLEHTLTRDNIIRDEHYAKANQSLEEVVANVLPAELASRLAGTPQPEHWQACAILIERSGFMPPKLEACKMWPTWDGVRVAAAQLGEEALFCVITCPLLEAVMKLSRPPLVLQGGPESDWWGSARAAKLRLKELASVYCLAEAVSLTPAQNELLHRASQVLRSAGGGALWAGKWRSRPVGATALSQRYDEPGQPRGPAPAGPGKTMINVDHASWSKVSTIATHDLPLAVALLSQRVVLEQGLVCGEGVLGHLLSQCLGLRT